MSLGKTLRLFFSPRIAFETSARLVQLSGALRDVAGWLPMKPDFRVAPNSQHFDFPGPCPAELAKSTPEMLTEAERP